MSNPADHQSNEQRGPIAWMAGNNIAANLAMIILIAGGIFMALQVQKEVYPDFQLDVVVVQVAYPGASPSEVEQGILLPIEETVKGVQGIREMTSTAREGTAEVQLELVAGIDRIKTFQEIDQAVNRIRTFPDDAEEPEVRLQSQQREVMEIGLYGDVDIWTLRKLAERVRDMLLNNNAITQVEIGNVPDYVTHVEIPSDRLREFNLTLQEVANRIARSSRDIPAGAVSTGDGEILLRVKERKQWAEEFASIPIISTTTGATVTLGELAQVRDGFEEMGFHSQFNRLPSVELEIYRIGNQSPLDIAEAVSQTLKELDNTLPPGVKYRIDSNAADDFQDRLTLLLENGAMALVIVLVILGIFLEYRLAFWIMMGMTISFVGSMLFLPVVDVSINMISMFAFLVVLGIVVDDAIVVGENVYEYRQRGMDYLTAAIRATRDIAAPVTFTILTTIVAFLPVMFLPGTTGKFWWPLPVVVITVLIISLVEALFILPAHLAHSSPAEGGGLSHWLHSRQRAIAASFDHFIDTRYRPFLAMCLHQRYITLTVAITLLLVTGGYGYSDHMGMILMPRVAADEIEAGVMLPVGTTRDQSAKVANEITEATHRMFQEHALHEQAEGIKTNVRRQNFIDVEIVLKAPDDRTMSAQDIIELWRDEIGDVEGVDQITFEAERGPGGWRDDISVDLSHSDIDVLAKASEAFFNRMKQFEATRDVNDSYTKGKLQFDYHLLPEAYALGLTSEEVGRQIRDAFYGAVAMRQLRGTNEIEVRVKLPESERKSLFELESLLIRTPSGAEVPLHDIAEVSLGEAFISIDRRDGRRIVTVGMDVMPQSATSRVIEAINTQVLPQLRADYPGITWSFQGSQAEMRESTQMLWAGFALAMFVVYSLLAIAFRSYSQPLIVMMAIPFGTVGAVIGHILLDYDLSLISLMGVVALSGVVVNGALIMVDYANRQRHELSVFEAIHEAGVRRFRPIVLTTLTTFGGLTPIILETSRQAYHLIPMAISLGFGIIFATTIMLVIVPCLYLALEDLLALLQRNSFNNNTSRNTNSNTSRQDASETS